MTARQDRRVHCTIAPHDGGLIEYVRYDRSGKWYRESEGRRTPIKIADAVAAAAQDRPAVIWHRGLAGGTQFDAKVRKARAAR